MKTKITSIAIVLLFFAICGFGQYASIENNSDISSFPNKSPLTSLENASTVHITEVKTETLSQVSENSSKEDVEIIYLPGEGLQNPYVILPKTSELPEVVFERTLYVEDWMKIPFLSDQEKQLPEKN
jgi:hypothetical protein